MSSKTVIVFAIFFVILSSFSVQVVSVVDDCAAEENNSCVNKKKALPLKIIALFSILVTSMIGVCLPLVTRSIPALSPDRSLFVIVKSFAGGIILATGFMHVLPDSFDMLTSSCLKEDPWHKFPFTGFVAMFSAIIALMIDSLATSLYAKKDKAGVLPESGGDRNIALVESGHCHHHGAKLDAEGSQMLRYRVIATVLETGIIVHSIVIGLSLGASNNTCTIKGLVAALCFHQMFEGMGLGGCILQAEYKFIKRAVMVFFFSVTTPFGITVGLALANTYKDTSPRALISEGLLNASSAGLLIYMALCDLLAADFMGPRLQGNVKLQLKSYVAVLCGAGGMSLMAKWA